MKMKKKSLIWLVLGLLLGCKTPQPPTHRTLVFHITGTLNDPKLGWEFARNDQYMGIRTDAELRSVRERYERHLSLTVRSIDRQATVHGRVRDSHRTVTRTTTRIESKR